MRTPGEDALDRHALRGEVLFCAHEGRPRYDRHGLLLVK